ncbi:bifunctional RecB family nuclease/DEAD/DEAH box helicase [Microbacterium sp.]|uniref:TM0106 family RecB-like putative nuclease n=1 Tax=Microbacterium sp. TaxID=51671 RepID=UPI002632287C|nr:bifunctional RecB family nuclease/DEAD/DEAH box helicase [Microbacterium sp.]MCV0335485.1 TM0106 family RecB-like putative nuclease [Microbacterium sp.]MCV0376023.1 TM0106 family RecB-like putative nuclease [Microbacterium sp.]MCV0390279.1 TM0106 family RecB-like putative nuclease [Microbacterium sp.]MCV0418014.1 TM0106 family RecB-like putative nuclease [Microbacterium sp.]MCV0422318.1 TM0106 family RecB-like putative nuclease [Microbacterium sp.]
MRIDTQAQRVIWSASDLKAAAECEFAWCRAIDAKLGRVPAVEEPEDSTLKRAAELGDVHEQNVLARYIDDLGDENVHRIEKVSSVDADALADAVDETIAALRSDAEVVFQAAFATEEFVGFADFLRKDHDGRWRVQDSKLARKARVTALMQLAAYVDQLDRLGIPRSGEVDLILGDGTLSTHAVDDLLPLFQVRRARLRALIADRRIAEGATGAPLAWGDDRGDLQIVACGRCATCEEQVLAHRDLLMVARMRPVQRARLRASGIETIDELAVAPDAPAGMNVDTFETLRAQARLQLRADAEGAPTFDVHYAQAIHTLPLPSHGDIFFDFEGDPLYTEPAPDGEAQWGIDYLFGWVDNADQYSALWAHTFADEKRALETFLDFVNARRLAHPGMHIYHYAPYETSHLVAMAARHGVREGEVDRLLREGVFVDLYPLVLRTVRVGSRSYSIKKLEPLYMGDDVRTSDVQKGDDSIVQYVAARELAAAGEKAEADAVLADLADYNRYDCVSTRRLRNWLIDIARRKGVTPAPPDDADEVIYEPSPRSVALLADAERAVEDGGDGLVHRIAAAAIDYFPREAKSFWVSHFQRLREPVTMWDGTRDVVKVDRPSSVVRREWSIGEGRRVMSRDIEIRGEVSPGTTLGPGAQPFALYEVPAPFDTEVPSRAVHVPHTVTVVEVLDDGYLVSESAVQGQTWDELPLALTPAAPPRVVSLQGAIDEWADAVHAAAPGFPHDAATDILRRIPPRTTSGEALPPARDDTIDAIVRGVLDLDRSYLAVQGPPGTGKTYTGSRVIARLVNEHGFKVGVVAQSHAIIETLLARIVADGVAPAQVAKAPKDPEAEPPYTVIPKNGMASFLAEHAGEGAVVGGTAWDFSNTQRVDRAGLDLLVIDEAGQFSLASTIAVAAGAKRLLLLGDPQQLPQVSQGAHPEPVDTSALGWVMDGDPVVRPEYGYFLARSWRMHPFVAAPVSKLAYAGQLASAPGTERRSLDGVDPGLHVVPLRHRGNATQSPEEAAEVVRLVRDLVGRTFTDNDPDASTRPLTPSDIIVVTPYNAQRQLVLDALSGAGFPDVPVGTVDNFQGKEAVVSITSLAASSGRDAPRGPEFLLLQNRLNVAISRAQVVAFLIHSPALLDDLPYTPEGVARLSAFARLVGAAE